MLLDISRRNLDRVLYFAQYIVTYVDEEARKKALQRLEDEISVSEREQAAGVNSKIAEIKTKRDHQTERHQPEAHHAGAGLRRVHRRAARPGDQRGPEAREERCRTRWASRPRRPWHSS